MISNIKTSVVLCTYNGEKYIEAQIRSILDQTVLADEIVVSDDGSSDRTLEIVRATLHEFPNKIVLSVNQSRLGYIKNFETAILKSSGDIVFLSDQDDVWLSNKIEVFLEHFNMYPETDLFFSDATIVNMRLDPLQKSFWQHLDFRPELIRNRNSNEVLNLLLKKPIVAGSMMCFRRKYFEHIFPLNENLNHDEWITLWNACLGTIDCIDKELILYRQHDSNQIGIGLHNGPKLGLGKVIDNRFEYYKRKYEGYRVFQQRILPFKIILDKKRMRNKLFDFRKYQNKQKVLNSRGMKKFTYFTFGLLKGYYKSAVFKTIYKNIE